MSSLSRLEITVRYAETDAMRVVYYANYFVYFEVARTTALGELGHPYARMEEQGVLIPVLDAACRYLKPARYGDVLTLETTRWRLGEARIRFDYQVLRQGEVLATGSTTHAFMNPEGKPIRPPRELLALFPRWQDPQGA
jgi:acyl-CoA thioester hydrolase